MHSSLLAAGGLQPRLQRYADIIVSSGQSLLSIINDILDLSKIEAGKLEFEKMPLDPAGIAGDVVGLYWEQAQAKGLDLAARVAANLPQTILGDPVRRRILELLADGELPAGELGAVIQREFGISQPGVSQHLRVLKEAEPFFKFYPNDVKPRTR